jgi:tetratricopeptide (TPR) repeat protein
MSAEARALYADARPVLILWAAALAIGVLLAAGWQAGLAGYVSAQREREPVDLSQGRRRLHDPEELGPRRGNAARSGKTGPESPTSLRTPRPVIYYQQRQDWKGALAAFDEAIKRGSTSLDVRGKSIWALIHLGRYEEAATYGQRCIDEGSDSPNFPRYAGEALYRGGQLPRAIPYLETALKSMPNDSMLMERLLACYKAAGDSEKAKRMEDRLHANEG